MKKKEIRAVVEKHIKSINNAYRKTRRHFDQDEIHFYRVEIKKFGAFLQLIEQGNCRRCQLKIPSKMRGVYNTVGLIRTLEIEQNKIIEYSNSKDKVSPIQYLNLIAGRAKDARDLEKETLISRNAFKNESSHLLARLPVRLTKSHIRKYINTKVNSLDKLIGDVVPGDESMHSIRKILKSLLYTRQFCKKGTVSLLSVWHLSRRDQIVTLTEIIGRFQDLTTSLNLLHEDFSKQSIEDAEENVMRGIEKQWTLQKETTRSDIYKILKAGVGDKKRVVAG